jgi:DeoR family fructose operon transcriptional repressor
MSFLPATRTCGGDLDAAVIALSRAPVGAPEGQVVGVGVTSMGESGVLLDAGATTSRLADIFPGRWLTVFTNTLPIPLALLGRPSLTVHPLGGQLRGPTPADVGAWTERALRKLNVDLGFLGTNGISLERGLTTPDLAEAATKQLALPVARRRILLADHSKVGLVSLCKHDEVSGIDLLITDSGPPDDQRTTLAATALAGELT